MEYDKLQLIENKAENLLSDLRNGDDSSLYSNALLVLVVLFLLSLVSVYIKTGEFKHLLAYLGILLVLLVLHKVKMSAAYKENALLKRYKQHAETDKQSYVSGLLKYLSSGMNVKFKRLKSVRLIYMIIFPLMLIILSELFNGESRSFILSLIVAYVLGATFWYFYFQDDINELDFAQDDVEDMITKLVL